MKRIYLASLLALSIGSAWAQPIGWKPVTSGNMEWGNKPQTATPPPVTFTPIGQSTFGSDGSSSYQTGNTRINSNGTSSQRTGNTTTSSDGTRSVEIGGITYVQRPDGSRYTCSKVGDQTICKY